MDSSWEMIPIFGMTFSFATAIVIIVVVSRARIRRQQIQADLQAKLIDKFGSSQELVAFLQSQTGRDFVNGVQTGQMRSVRDRAANAVRVGIMFTAIGLAFLFLWPLTRTVGLAWPGIFLFLFGCAYFASAYSLMRFNSTGTEQPQPPAMQ